MTRQRKVIHGIIERSEGHLTADQVYHEARKLLPNIAMGTVYRNLNRMVEEGELLRLPVRNGPDYFDRTLTHHGHLICESCGRIRDLDLPNIREDIRDYAGVQATSYDLNVYYICPDCAEERIESTSA